ncbi:XrtA/PEP-CTERM system TPR-repeat protein PrsT [Siccirubricoccus phaeus]|uniref:XrtA/PEP-CTERM system TPR-repeat protein PrsT n=1 Tax=Siccirubricoccus phaeus TaxID=2595053 RepID=UPI00165A157C|nr:XrtA/PEP-CTERM system TPR-repeat protein PrsT [Siccirubricoccus phaeus]
MAPPTPTRRHARWPLLLAGLLSAGLAAAPAAAQPLERARAAQARGDMRAAQIELRNAVRQEPNSAALRAALAQLSLDIGDADTAEKEARAAMERGFDPAAGTAIVMRAYLQRTRFQELLRDFPMPPDGTPPALAGEVAAHRAFALLATREVEQAKAAVAEALRLAPGSAQAHLAASSLALAQNDRPGAMAAIERSLAIDPDLPEGLLRRAALLFDRGDHAEAVATLDRLLAKWPAQVQGRLLRAEVRLRADDLPAARQDVEAVLRAVGNNPGALYLRAVLATRERDWRGADESLQRLGAGVGNFPEGFLVLATVKRALGQNAQALDAAGRYAARRPEDPRGAKLLAVMEMEAGRPDGAIGALERLLQRGAVDAEALDMLGRARVAAGRPREGAQAFARAAELAPADAGIRTRLAAARLAAGDTDGTAAAAEDALRLAPSQAGAREMLMLAALGRGDLAAAEGELAQLGPEARAAEVPATVAAMIRLARLQTAEARAGFEDVLKRFPESIGARVGLARTLMAQGVEGEPERLLGEVLQRQPNHGEAISRLLALTGAGGSRAPAARQVLQRAQAAAPGEPALALAMAQVLRNANDAAGAAALLDGPALRVPGRGVALPLARSQAYAAAEKWPEAEAAARAALAEDASSAPARRQLAALLARGGDAQGAEALLQEGLRSQPRDALLQQGLIGLVNEARGAEAALALADRMGQDPGMQPNARLLKPELLLSLRRPLEAAQAYAAQLAAVPSASLVLRTAGAWMAAGRPVDAEAVLTQWLQREPGEVEVLNLLAQIDIAAGRTELAEHRLSAALQRAPNNSVAMNNLAWLLAQQDSPEAVARARELAERAYFLLPTPETADTLGWVLTRQGEARRAVPLLRAAVAVSRRGPAQDAGGIYRLAFALKEAGDKVEAKRLVDLLLDRIPAFPERAEAERLRGELLSP